MSVKSQSNPFVCLLRQFIFLLLLFSISFPTMAEYYLVPDKHQLLCHPHSSYHSSSSVSSFKKHHSSIYSESNAYYNLDRATGDDDPYVDPEMNIDR